MYKFVCAREEKKTLNIELIWIVGTIYGGIDERRRLQQRRWKSDDIKYIYMLNWNGISLYGVVWTGSGFWTRAIGI